MILDQTYEAIRISFYSSYNSIILRYVGSKIQLFFRKKLKNPLKYRLRWTCDDLLLKNTYEMGPNMVESLHIDVRGQGLHSFTAQVEELVAKANIDSGLCTLFIRHTSASLLIQENADPSARYDLERWLNRLVPENDALFTHTLEGSDDMPAHIKSALTATSLSVPIKQGRLLLGTWQGIYLWEHRHAAARREVVVHIGG